MNIDHYQLTLCALRADKMIQNIDRNSQGEQNRYLLKLFILPEKEEKKVNETTNIIFRHHSLVALIFPLCAFFS